MHPKLYILGILLNLSVWNTYDVSAQEVVLRGSMHQYSTSAVSGNANYSYNWSVSGGTLSDFGNNSTSEPVLWDGPPGDYTVSMFPTDNRTGCAGNNKVLKVKVLDFFIRWQGAITTICSAWGNEDRDFSVVVEFTPTTSPWSFEYQIDNKTPIKVNVNGGSSKVINIRAFISQSNTQIETHRLRITRITTPDGHTISFDGKESDAVSHTHFVTVNPIPPPGTIEHVRDL